MRNLAELRDTYRDERAGEFAAYGRALMLRSAGVFIEHDKTLPDRAKALVSASTSSDLSATSVLQAASTAFLDSLQTAGAFDRIRTSALRAPIDGASAIRYSTSTITGSEVGEAKAKPISAVSLDAAAITKTKASALLVLTTRALRDAGPEAAQLVSRELRAGVVGATDSVFLAALTAGATSVPVGTSILADLQALADALSPGAASQLFLVVSPSTARKLALVETSGGDRAFPNMMITGGSIGGIEVISSDHLPAGQQPIMVDSSQLVLAAGDVALDSTEHASIEMDSAPTQDSSTGTGSEVVSLWQSDSIGLRAERRLGYAKVRTTAVAQLSGAAW